MELLILRHAIAFPRDPKRWPDDSERPLTMEGVKRARRAAAGLKRIAKRPALVLTSPLVRARDTAAIFAQTAHWPEATECAALSPDGPPEEVLEMLTAPWRKGRLCRCRRPSAPPRPPAGALPARRRSLRGLRAQEERRRVGAVRGTASRPSGCAHRPLPAWDIAKDLTCLRPPRAKRRGFERCWRPGQTPPRRPGANVRPPQPPCCWHRRPSTAAPATRARPGSRREIPTRRRYRWRRACRPGCRPGC